MGIHISKDQDKYYDSQAAEMRKTRDSSVESKVNGPFVHNLPKRKTVTRRVFTFRGIQSTHGVTHHMKEQKMYNNMYPDVPTNSGLVSSFLSRGSSKFYMLSFEEIPISLWKTEKRPTSQRQTTTHAKRKAETIERRLKKSKRVHEQRTRWGELEKKGLKTDPK